MRLDVDLSGLQRAVERMGADGIDLGPVVVGRLESLEPIDVDVELPHPGIARTKGELLADGTGRQVVLLIRAHRRGRFEAASENPRAANKFHVVDCYWLAEKYSEGTLDRYSMTNDFSGKFKITDGGDRETVVRLRVCQYCLAKLDPRLAEDKEARRRRVESFDLQTFMAACNFTFPHLPTGLMSGIDQYSEDWADRSRAYREGVGWTCEACEVDASPTSRQYLLHCHHRSGVKTDNRPSNLVALCAECHAGQHGHMSVREKDLDRLRELRREQGLSDPVFPVRRKKVTLLCGTPGHSRSVF